MFTPQPPLMVGALNKMSSPTPEKVNTCTSVLFGFKLMDCLDQEKLKVKRGYIFSPTYSFSQVPYESSCPYSLIRSILTKLSLQDAHQTLRGFYLARCIIAHGREKLREEEQLPALGLDSMRDVCNRARDRDLSRWDWLHLAAFLRNMMYVTFLAFRERVCQEFALASFWGHQPPEEDDDNDFAELFAQ